MGVYIELPSDNVIPISAPDDSIVRVKTSNIKSHNTKTDTVAMSIVKGYSDQDLTSATALATAFATYLEDLKQLKTATFLVNPET